MVHVYLTADANAIAVQLENLSKFVQIALSEAVGVMQFALMKEARPDIYYDVNKFEDLIDEYNAAYPADPLTKARKEKREAAEWLKNSQNEPELW